MLWKYAVTAIAALVLTSCAEARPRGAPVQDEPAVTTCNMNTGICTGQDAGTGLFTAAVCDGVTNTLPAFNSFNTWALSSTTQAQGKLIELRVTGTCFASGGNARPFKGLTKARLWAYGTSFTGTGSMPGLGVADTTPGICHKGLNDAAGCSARINTVSAGATSVTINTTGFGGSLSTLCSRFVAGKWAVITGFDLQGQFNGPFGYPPNPHFLDYAQIVSTTNCASTGAISISRALTYGYLSTWVNFNSGNGSEADSGGPGTIYALDQYWGGEVDLRGFALTDATNQSIYQGRKVTLTDVTMAGAACIIPSQNETFTMINSTGTSCGIEVDKLINNLTYTNTSLNRLRLQSSSTNLLTWNGGSIGTDIDGTPKVANISNVSLPILRLGPRSYGTPTSATCTNCVISAPITDFGLIEKGPGNSGANIFYAVSGGVFSYPLGVNVTNLTNNGSGKVRLTVGTTTGWATVASYSSLFSSCSAPSPCSGGSVISVINGATIDMTDYNFADVTWTGSGFLFQTAEQERWAIPGTNVTTAGLYAAQMPFFQVTGVTQSGNFVNIATTLAGAFPTTPLTGGLAYLQVQGPKWTCTNCSGNAQAVDFSGAPAAIPLASYSNRSYANSTTLVNSPLWGKLVSATINVSDAYTGSTTPLTFSFSESGVLPTGVASGWGGTINLRQAGIRVITPAGVTCDTGGGPVGGGCAGDGTLTLPDPALMFSSNMNLSKSAAPVDDTWAMSAVFVMDQGVVP